MKKVLFLTPLALAAMAGCAPKVDRIQEGQWETIAQLTAAEMPNAPPETQQQIRRQINVDQPQPAQCLSREQAGSFLRELRGGEVPPGCQVSDEVYAGGLIRSTITCAAQPGRPAVTVRIDGTFTATTLNATITQEATTPQGTMRQSQRIRSRRTGDCTPAPAMPMPMPAPPPSADPAPAGNAATGAPPAGL